MQGALRKFKMIKLNNYYLSNKSPNIKKLSYWLSFLIPGMIFFLYFAFHNFNILTVDLGQQYVDFFAFFRRNLFSHPFQLIYSFQNGLGGSMLATDAYYLLSPFNIIFFLFSKNSLPVAILTIISLKIATAGLTSFYYWQEKTNSIYALAASLAYALSGYIIANHFNLMWLDSVILLPLLIQAIDYTLNAKRNHLMIITFALWVTNFYTGFMTLFFGFLYLLSQIFLIEKQKRMKTFLHYLKNSILGSFLAAFLLLPVFFEMLAGKANSAVKWDFPWQFPPFQELGKITDGAYNFHEMEAGMPNIFMTMPFLVLILAYFLCQKIDWQHKLGNGILILFLIFSLFFTPFVLIWHLGQFPVWYPGRFSFILVFLSINLGILFLQTQENLSWWKKIIIAVLLLCLVIYWTLSQDNWDFLSDTSLIVSTAFIVLALLFIFFIFPKYRFNSQILIGIILIETIINLLLSLNNLSYQQNHDYTNFVKNSTEVTNYLAKKNTRLYRTEKTFYRSDDDPFSANYNGISSFNSVTDQKVINFLAYLGYLHNSNSVTNNGGTPVTDSILGIKYYLQPNYAHDQIKKSEKLPFDNPNHRLDLDDYTIQKEFKQLLLLKNSHALPLVFKLNQSNSHLKFNDDTPIENQQLLLKKITDTKEKVFRRLIWPDPQLKGVNAWDGGWMQYTKKKKANQSEVTFALTAKSNNSYYLEIPNGIDEDQASLYVNNAKVDLSVRDSQAHLINLGHNQKGTKIVFTFVLNQKTFNLNSANLWSLNTTSLNRILQKYQRQQPQLWQTNSLVLHSNQFSTDKKQLIASTIPYSKNWLIFDNGHLQKKRVFADAFLSTKLASGKHHLTFVYIPFAFLLGVLISLISLIYIKLHLD